MPSQSIRDTADQSAGTSARSSARASAAASASVRAPSSNIVDLRVVVEGELERMRAQPHGVDLVLALPVDPGPDQLFAEHAALEQELVVGFERVERFRQRARNLRDAVVVLEEVEVARIAGVETALDPVEAREQHRREGEVRIRGRVRAAELDPLRR